MLGEVGKRGLDGKGLGGVGGESKKERVSGGAGVFVGGVLAWG